MSEKKSALKKSFKKRRVLVVEDDPQGGKLIEMTLLKLGIKDISRAQDGKAGWEAINNADEAFDLIISDWNMPEMTGIELLTKVREEYNDLPFIMITARGTMNSVMEAQDEDVTSFIPKPYTPQQLMEKVTSIFKGPLYDHD